jgi:hypothetical protein
MSTFFEVRKIIVHCSDSDRPGHDSIEVIRQWHTARGFVGADDKPGTKDDVGYHFFIRKDGTLELGRALNQVGAHTAGHNSDSIGICQQFDTLARLIEWLRRTYGNVPVHPHRKFNKGKTCPNFYHSLLTE